MAENDGTIDDCVARLREWAQNEEMINQYFTQHGRDCNRAADWLESYLYENVW